MGHMNNKDKHKKKKQAINDDHFYFKGKQVKTHRNLAHNVNKLLNSTDGFRPQQHFGLPGWACGWEVWPEGLLRLG